MHECSPSRLRRRLLAAFVGWMAISAGIASVAVADMGSAPYDVLSTGLAERLDVGLGAVVGLSAAVMGALAALLGRRPGWGTAVGALVVGVGVTAALPLLDGAEGLPDRIALLAGGLVLLTAGIVATAASGVGIGPPDLVMLAVCDRGLPVALVRWALEFAFLGVGLVLGGRIGPGTLGFVVIIGPALQVLVPLARQHLEDPGPAVVASPPRP